MNIRYLIECEHCKKKIALRIGVGYSQTQPFDIPCKFCGNYIHGSLNLDGFKTDLILKQATVIKGDIYQADYAIEIHEDFPIIEIDPNELRLAKILTPFMRQISLMGEENLHKFGRDMSLFRINREHFFPIIERLNNFFISGEFTEMSRALQGISSYRNKIEIIKSLAQLNELFIIPILNKPVYQRNIDLYQRKIIETIEKNKGNLESFVNTLISIGILEDLQKQIYEIVNRFSINFDLFKSAIPLQYYTEQGNFGGKMQLSKNNFDLIKSIFVDSFELMCRNLIIFEGISNILKRDSFDDCSNTSNKNVKNLNDFIRENNFYKIEILKEQDNEFKNIIDDVLDNKLRNGIGHYKAHFEIKTQKIIYYPFKNDINKAEKKEIYYIDFVKKTLDLLVLTFSVNYLITCLFAIFYSSKNRRSLGLKNIELDFERDTGKKEPQINYIYFWNEMDYTTPDVFDYDFAYWNFYFIYDYYNFKDAEKVHIDKNSLIFEDVPSDTKIIVDFNTNIGKKWHRLYSKNKRYSIDSEIFKPAEVTLFSVERRW